jgi:hypothetical protein
VLCESGPRSKYDSLSLNELLLRTSKFGFENVHIRACKSFLGVRKSTCNVGVHTELGILPYLHNIICKLISNVVSHVNTWLAIMY